MSDRQHSLVIVPNFFALLENVGKITSRSSARVSPVATAALRGVFGFCMHLTATLEPP